MCHAPQGKRRRSTNYGTTYVVDSKNLCRQPYAFFTLMHRYVIKKVSKFAIIIVTSKSFLNGLLSEKILLNLWHFVHYIRIGKGSEITKFSYFDCLDVRIS